MASEEKVDPGGVRVQEARRERYEKEEEGDNESVSPSLQKSGGTLYFGT